MSVREMFHMLSAQDTFMVVEGKKKKFQKYDCHDKHGFPKI